jgi:cytochrome c-type biogenesis protein CcmH
MNDHYLFRIRTSLLITLMALAVGLSLAGWQAAAAQDVGEAATAAATAAAQEEPLEPAPEAVTATVPAGAAAGAAAGVTANDVNDVARQLWCPLCSGVRLDACELKACAQMKDVISDKLASGEDVSSIKNYFVAQYGPQVLGEPPMEGFNWLAWILPVLALAAGGLFVLSRVRNSTQRAQQVHAQHTPAETQTAAAGDAYSRKLDEELKHYD